MPPKKRPRLTKLTKAQGRRKNRQHPNQQASTFKTQPHKAPENCEVRLQYSKYKTYSSQYPAERPRVDKVSAFSCYVIV